MTSNGVIFIASCSYDWAHLGPVVHRLEAANYRVMIYEADKVAEGIAVLDVYIKTGKGMHVRYDNEEIPLDTIAAAWFRKPHILTMHIGSDKLRTLSIVEEIKRLQDGLWQLIPANKWLNAPSAISKSDHKLAQLAQAERLGFSVPPTVVTNAWDFVERRLPKRSEIVFKPFRSQVYAKNEVKFLHTTVLQNNIAELCKLGSPYPGIWQQNIVKKREWRVTVVGEAVFAAAIYTTKEAKDDWRKHQGGPNVEFKAETLPQDIQDKCLAYLHEAKLAFGVFDFIETEQGEIVFLEMNPNGQYLWLEEELGLPISNAISEQLVAIAQTMDSAEPAVMVSLPNLL